MRTLAVGDGPPAVAYAISRRVGNAVIRNRVRRRLRTAVARQERLLRPGHAYLVGVSPAAADVTYRELEDRVRECLEAA